MRLTALCLTALLLAPAPAGAQLTASAAVDLLAPRPGHLLVTDSTLEWHPADAVARAIVWQRTDGGRGPDAPGLAPEVIDTTPAGIRVALSMVTLLLSPAEADTVLALRVGRRTSPVDVVPVTDTAAALTALVTTPYADTLWQLVDGRPRQVLVMPDSLAGQAIGWYHADGDVYWFDIAWLNDPAIVRHVLAHEVGHELAEAAHPADVRALWLGVAPLPNLYTYGYGETRDAIEHKAQAFASAAEWFSRTSRATPAAAWADLRTAEALLPGTEAMARWILAQPIGRGHPLAPQLAPSARGGAVSDRSPILSATARPAPTP